VCGVPEWGGALPPRPPDLTLHKLLHADELHKEPHKKVI
jgi:hypothetical protein